MITRIYDEAGERAALESIGKGIAVIEFLGDGEGSSVPLVHCDDAAIAEMALDYLREQGFRRFAFYGIEGAAWSVRRGQTFHEQVVLVGVNDDSVVCNMCTPTLSSIDASHFEIGYRAARMLEELMDGGAPPGTPTSIPPSRLVVRGCSGKAVTDDPQIARAARFISRNAGSPIGVDDVVASVTLSRRELQRRFRLVTGKTIHSSLLDARMEIAKRLLVAGEYTVEAVAERSGFGSRQHSTKTFSSQTGITPAKYRRDFGAR